MIKLVLGAAIGAALGGWIGHVTKCSGGGCPLVGNPVGGVLMGAVIGGLLVSSFAGRSGGTLISPSPHVEEVQGVDAFDAALRRNKIVLADFYADWCGPCRRLKPAIHAIADEYAGRIGVVAVNVDRNKELASAHRVSGIPDVRIFASGIQAEQIVGLRGKDSYASVIDRLLNDSTR